jgi:hypothetical protein
MENTIFPLSIVTLCVVLNVESFLLSMEDTYFSILWRCGTYFSNLWRCGTYFSNLWRCGTLLICGVWSSLSTVSTSFSEASLESDLVSSMIPDINLSYHFFFNHSDPGVYDTDIHNRIFIFNNQLPEILNFVSLVYDSKVERQHLSAATV